jgi:hypothetical protein
MFGLVPGIDISKCESIKEVHGRDNLGHAAAGRSRMHALPKDEGREHNTVH